MKALDGRFDGKVVVLDSPIDLKPDTKVKVRFRTRNLRTIRFRPISRAFPKRASLGSGIIRSMPITTNFKKGAVVLLPFPFSNQSGVKLRPAVVAHSQNPSQDLLVVGITSVAGHLRAGETSIVGWREAGLLHPSFLKRAVATVEKSIVQRYLGMLPEADVVQLERSLRP